MKLILYISSEIGNEIQSSRNALYKEKYRNDNQNKPSSKPHITIALFNTESRQMLNHLTKTFTDIYSKYSNNEITDFHVVNESMDNTNWISIKIFDQWLKDFNREVETILNGHGINDSREYKEEIRKIRRQYTPKDVNLNDCIADHINLINKCKPEMAEKALDQFQFINNIDSIKTSGIDIKS